MLNMKFLSLIIFLNFLFSCAVRNIHEITELDTSLNLSKKGLREIPKSVFENKQLKVLKLFGNEISEIPSRIAELENLEELYIGKNNLKSLPPEIGKLKNLKILSVQYNSITSLPSEIGDMENLEQLWLNQNNLKFLPSEIGKLKKLVRLQVEFNFLTKIPSELGECESLGFIFLGRNNLVEIPEELGKLNHLKEIYLAGAGALVDVPESFCYLRYLEILEIDKTTSIPACLLVHQASRLRIIQK